MRDPKGECVVCVCVMNDVKNYKIKHFCFTLKRSQVNFSFNVVIVCKVLKSLPVVVHAKLIILSGLCNTKL